MIIEQVVKTYLDANTDITDLVSTRIYLQNNDPEKNDFTAELPLITFAPVVETFNVNSKVVSPFQITARAKTYLEAVTIADHIVDEFHGKKRPEYNESVVRSKNRLYDATVKAHGIAVTVDFIYRKAV